MKEYIAGEIGVKDGEVVVKSMYAEGHMQRYGHEYMHLVVIVRWKCIFS